MTQADSSPAADAEPGLAYASAPDAQPEPERTGEFAPTDTPLQVLLVGPGAVGAFYCGKLAQAGARVSVVSPRHHAEITRHGFRIDSVLGDFHFQPEAVYHDMAHAPPPEVLVVALKVLPDVDTAAIIRPAVGSKTTILLLQNGVDIEAPVAGHFADQDLLSALAFVGIHRLSPTHIEHQLYGRLSLGRYPAGIPDRARQLAALWGSVGIEVDLAADIVAARWKKLVWNAAFNAMSVLAGGATTRQILDQPEARRLAQSVMHEVMAIAAAAGHPLPEELPNWMFDHTENMPPYQTSMLLDYLAGRPMEVEAIIGNAHRSALHHGVDTPVIDAFYALLTLINADREGRR